MGTDVKIVVSPLGNEHKYMGQICDANGCKPFAATRRVTDRKDYPLCTGVLDYFPDALMEVSRVSQVGNDQHNPGEKLHWAREKSQDEENTALRHMRDRFKKDSDGTYHAAKAAWRMLAFLQKLIEAERRQMSYEDYLKLLREKPDAWIESCH